MTKLINAPKFQVQDWLVLRGAAYAGCYQVVEIATHLTDDGPVYGYWCRSQWSDDQEVLYYLAEESLALADRVNLARRVSA